MSRHLSRRPATAGRAASRSALPAATAVAVLLVAGCSSSPASPTSGAYGHPSPTTASSSAAPATAGGPTLSISGFAFSTTTVKPGATVTVINADSVAHTVKLGGTAIDVNVPGGGQATFTAPAKPGTYPLTCDFHKGMHGTLTVAA